LNQDHCGAVGPSICRLVPLLGVSVKTLRITVLWLATTFAFAASTTISVRGGCGWRGRFRMPVAVSGCYLASLCLVLISILPVSAQAATRAATHEAPVAAYGRLPISFEENRGQSATTVHFLARGPGYALFLARSRAVLALEGSAGARGHDAALELAFLGAYPRSRLRGAESLRGRVNYIRSGRPEISAPTFRAVRYSGLWPGIAARFYGSRRHLEYDFDLAPGVDPGQIGLRFRGQSSARLAADGSLLLRLGSHLIRQPPPQAFQYREGSRRPVASRYRLSSRGRVAITVGRYDHDLPLTIDPRLVYSSYVGLGAEGIVRGVAVGTNGSAYLTGFTPSSSFPRTTGPFRAKSEQPAAFVTKLNPSGTGIVYSTVISGPSGSHGREIAVDKVGDAFFAGTAESADFPRPHGSFRSKDAGNEGAFVAKLGPDGRHLLYAVYLGRRDGGTGAVGLAIDRHGAAYVTGMTDSRHFPTTEGAFQQSDPHRPSVIFRGSGYVAKIAPSGKRLAYSTYLSAKNELNRLTAIAVDSSGHAYVTGRAESSGFPTTKGAFERKLPKGGFGVLVTKLNKAGTGLVYSTFISAGQDAASGNAIAVDSRGRAFVVGETRSPHYPTTAGAAQHHLVGALDFLVSALSPDGSRLESSTLLGAVSREGAASESTGIGLLSNGDVAVTGTTNSTGWPTTRDAAQPMAKSLFTTKSVLTVLSPDLRHNVYSTYFTSPHGTKVKDLAVGPAGSVYIAGDSHPGLRQTVRHLPRLHLPHPSFHRNAFVAKFDFSN
jgi:uncharacterized protein YidB (DUF937 family)